MAGSFRHVTDSEGAYIGLEFIDNLGDADEALEECVVMINLLADQLVPRHLGPDERKERRLQAIFNALEAYRAAEEKRVSNGYFRRGV